MQSGKHKYKKLEVMQPRITEYESELLTREQIIPDPPNEVLQNNDKREGRGDELKRMAVLLISFPWKGGFVERRRIWEGGVW